MCNSVIFSHALLSVWRQMLFSFIFGNLLKRIETEFILNVVFDIATGTTAGFTQMSHTPA